MTTDLIPGMTAEEDFEFVPSQSHDHDDLSSIISNSGETDNESDAGALDSQAGSNITLRMPQVTETNEHLAEVGDARSERKSSVAGLQAPEATVGFDLKSHERVELPILYLGPEVHKKKILSKIASALLPEFTSDVWTSTTYSVLPSYNNNTAEVFEQSRLSFRVLTDFKQLSGTGTLGTGKSPIDRTTQENIDAARLYKDVPQLLLVHTEKEICDASSSGELACDTLDLMSTGDSTEVGHTRKRSLTMSEFLGFEGQNQEYLTERLVFVLDHWHESKNSREELKESRGSMNQASPYKLLPWVLLLISAVMHFSTMTSGSLNRLSAPGNLSTSSITFHQITETNALIEVPVVYRAQPVDRLPRMTAVVTRDGKQVHSRLQLVVDNLYSLDWAQTEAHGELVVTAQMAAQKKTLEDAYIIQYSAKTPFLLSLIEKAQDLHHLGHLPEVDFSRRVNELIKQVEDGRSYAVSVSQDQFRYIRESSSEGLKRLSVGYPGVIQASGDSIKGLLAKSSAVGAQIGQQSAKQMANAEAGLKKLKRMVHKHKPLVQKHSLPTKWAHQLRKNFRSGKN
ncbi:protein of unknown function [Taphrina deformans PYCC 5710]|uniref:Uncharacterized protein n=1 Tax=Taphrina deformans (strain PYCC 5710 / ATCC 11124 / CBS 356.35 / IMI 108563 / JCM 9778 / NBRC 8474) TaxID=1097556 RepID=R4X886_TAPDE|nr:protein of unknown function [Taphrina deformans PYCC 5710]|eukprot:CCG81477.1 protein of unknown function [Taphrina deformans PYCC 5710]